LKPSLPPSTWEAGAAVCDLAAYGWVRAPAAALAELRRTTGPVGGEPLPASFLKHADEQTVAGLAAVYHAIHEHGLGDTCFTDWGVLAAPCLQGRAAVVSALLHFKAEGAWGVSPHLIPHRSLHSISGAVSLALRIHGPNFGVGGGPGAAAEVLPAALALLERQRLPGVWVVVGAMDPNRAPTPGGEPDPASVWVGGALALRPARPDWKGIRLRIGTARPASEYTGPALDPLRLRAALEQLATPDPGPPVSLGLGGGLWLELGRAGAPGLNGVAVNGHHAPEAHRGNGHVTLHPPHANGKAHHPAVVGRPGAEAQR
jgi:hypothetical protein